MKRRSINSSRTVVLTVLMLGMPAAVLSDSDQLVSFVTCPIYRDANSGKKSGCWLADDGATGRRYDVTQSPTKPDWNKEVLIEGRVTAEKDVCGGIVLSPVRVSLLPGACVPKMLPAESFPGRVFVLPERNLRPPTEARPQPQKPYTEKTFYLFFDFDRDFLVYQLDDYFLDRAVTFIRAVKPREIVITGFAATEPMTVSGRTLRESTAIAQQRAETVSEALRRLGVPPTTIRTKWQDAAQPVNVADADRLPEASRRRVEILVRP